MLQRLIFRFVLRSKAREVVKVSCMR